ncbi:hypothetical protein B0T17DRAFT_535214 [Bombardia bombarda]|uniref:Uncharacterized protein n=1 Tax=Bombardia bombarda TaxID=252184 RepID=A0AA40C1T7_9PEZI|nr:hypothetical protein B0T17DRAFT_535214 [Bombardia bombarda]
MIGLVLVLVLGFSLSGFWRCRSLRAVHISANMWRVISLGMFVCTMGYRIVWWT